MTRATALLALDKGQTMTAVAAALGITISTLSTLAKKYRTEKLLCLNDKVRSGRPPQISGEQRAKITGLACSTPPEGQYPDATRITVVQDNLNTHDVSAFYEVFDPEKAFALSQRFEFFYTPKSASWLNMIEIEFSAIARACLHRRIPTMAQVEQVEKEVMALIKEREEKKIMINWQFSIESARSKFKSHYDAGRTEEELL